MVLRKSPYGTKNKIGVRVARVRKNRGMKQNQLLAKLQLMGLDFSKPMLSNLERQRRPVTDFELDALADILGVSVDWLLGREE